MWLIVIGAVALLVRLWSKGTPLVPDGRLVEVRRAEDAHLQLAVLNAWWELPTVDEVECT